MYAALAAYAGATTAALAALGPVAALLYKARRDLRAMRRVLHEDELTGMANRRAYHAYLDGARDRRRSVAIALIDLDQFKSINDRFGHHAGDQVLRQVAARLRGLRHAVGLSARLSGDEFVLVIDDAAAAGAVARRVWVLISAVPFAVGHERLHVTASIGVAQVADCGYHRVLHSADLAMYQAKMTGAGIYMHRGGRLPAASPQAARNPVDRQRIAA